jgi:hypothetical protein
MQFFKNGYECHSSIANTIYIDHARKDDKKSQEPTVLKIFFPGFTMFLD